MDYTARVLRELGEIDLVLNDDDAPSNAKLQAMGAKDVLHHVFNPVVTAHMHNIPTYRMYKINNSIQLG